jgi:hypothetical protein
MIKFTGITKDGGRLIGLGLSRANCERLLFHRPIKIDLRSDLNIPWKGEILLLAGETEATLTHELREFIGEDVLMHAEEGLEDPPDPPAPIKSVPGFQCIVGADLESGKVIFDLQGKAVTQFGLTADGARRLAEVLINEAAKLEVQP